MTRARTPEERLVELRRLVRRVEREIEDVERQIARRGRGRVQRRSRYAAVPDCGTEAKYHWHRANEPDNWPLPVEDPCGCRAAHSRHESEHRAARRAAREDQVRAEVNRQRDLEVDNLRKLAGLRPILRSAS